MRKQVLLLILSVFILSSCSIFKQKDYPTYDNEELNQTIDLYQTEWQLIKMGSKKPKLTDTDEKITIIFSKDNSHIAGYSGCNRYGGQFTIKKDVLSFGSLFATKMACPEMNMNFEHNYLNSLDKVTGYNIVADTLFLNKGERPALIFIAK
ncbi:MAG TPA: META domain-containing protein [Bacteroidales bacterium]|nr:META domain-containing protein [Bacteroidales bacterium]